jgi:hypothetical protein
MDESTEGELALTMNDVTCLSGKAQPMNEQERRFVGGFKMGLP